MYNLMYMLAKRAPLLFLTFNYLIILGVTLVFSTGTRSVFEVNKLFFLKLGISLIGIMFFYDYLIGERRWFCRLSKHKWFNGALLATSLSALASTIFSVHPQISIYGSYDRWEGLLTTAIYLFLAFCVGNFTEKRTLIAIVWALIVAIGLSSLYGIVQALGIDIVQWSMDPSMRVFGSINNPVHYCALMGMGILLIIGMLLHTVHTHPNTPLRLANFGWILVYYGLFGLYLMMNPVQNASLAWIARLIVVFGAPYGLYLFRYIKAPSIQNVFDVLFTSLLLVIYATYLSFSRATWLGLTAALGMIFAIIILNNSPYRRYFFRGIVGITGITLLMYLIVLFNLVELSVVWLGVGIVGMAVSYGLIAQSFKAVSPYSFLLGALLITAALIPQAYAVPVLIGVAAMRLLYKPPALSTEPVSILIVILLMLTIQFIGQSALAFMYFVGLLLCLVASEPSVTPTQWLPTNTIFRWLLLIIGLFSLTILTPTIYVTLQQKLSGQSNSLITNAADKISSYQSVAITGTARSSMWKSAFPWFLDHPIYGSGLDTIKYYYPKYRRSEYGKLEGGHNFTPDRLHNEYLNTLATKGLLGFITFYGVLVGGVFIIALRAIRNQTNPYQYILLGLLGSALVYLGQVMFNFGVVATLVYFYYILGLCTGFSDDQTP
jgi:O-antigen ligase